MLLYINGQQADLAAGQVIAQTKQVNDLNSLDNRQANYTNKFRLPKTANNLRIMNYLSLTGNDSNIPYQKNECSLYSETGECFVYKGWAVITDGGDTYEAVIYDGIIDLYKAIENLSLADVGLKDLTHEKNINTVILSWVANNDRYFKYIVADYNGKTMTTAPISNPPVPAINIDYLVPSVKVSWLWDKIFTTNSFDYNGTIFDSADFNNLWITYPKGTPSVESEELLYESEKFLYQGQRINAAPYVQKYMVSFETTDKITIVNNSHLTVPQTGKYKLEISGNLQTKKYLYTKDGEARGTVFTPCNMIMSKNATDKTPLTLTAAELIANNIEPRKDFTKTLFLTLSENDTICIGISASEDNPKEPSFRNELFRIDSGSSLKVTLSKIEPGVFDFSAAYADFSMRDFLNEIVHRYGLTMYKDKYTGSYTFLTLKELLEESAVADWSSKFAKKVSENYIYGNYARQNWLRYSYNEKENTHNDGCIRIENENLADTRDVIKSKIYSPEKTPVTLLNRVTNVYRLWDKEIVEDPEPNEAAVTYKPLDKRYYFLRAEVVNEARLIASDLLEDWGLYSKIPFETFTDLSFNDIVQKYYAPLQQILDKACIITADLMLKDTDVINFDFKKRYYIEQLGANFIMNKINNYVPGKPTRCELIKVPDNLFEPFAIKIHMVSISSYEVKVYYTATEPLTGVIAEYDSGGEAWMAIPLTGSSPAVFSLERGTYKLQLRAKGKLSNNVSINIPDVRTINIP